ncbi:hypothetical protein [Bradyrhizobium jicamae]|uniref:hypothetical protein n=1 Tax=Bradyrhizobium jicamae TaxID=280332 RepID=UPI001BA6CF11|nr:hypothetical protein [Bradyrhizobium jicamae]MBR0934415.1 hypothetical protein [Bradyrhizobium jicamae]
MPLHRDIHWLGRQWAVTGHGLQLINQKLEGFFDIEVARLWEPGVIEAMQSKAWINREDFDKAVEVARVRFSGAVPAGVPLVGSNGSPQLSAPPARHEPVEPSTEPTLEELLAKLKARSSAITLAAKPAEAAPAAPPTVEHVALEPTKPVLPEAEPRETASATPAAAPRETPVISFDDPAPSRSKPVWPAFDCKMTTSARLVRSWHVRVTRWHGNLPGLPPRP